MNELKPPTDSLYKFIAIFGLVAFLGSYYAAYKSLDAYTIRSTEFFEHVDDGDGKKFKTLQSLVAGRVKGDIDGWIRSLPQKERGPAASLYFALETLEPTHWNIWAVRYIGLAMMFFGFTFWYWRVQRHIDYQLQRDSRELRSQG